VLVLEFVYNGDPLCLTDLSSISQVQLDEEMPVNVLSITLHNIVAI